MKVLKYMQIYFHVYPEKKPRRVALGTFDGVHIGHAKLFNNLSKKDVTSLVYTFDLHPLNVLFGEGTVKSINTNLEKEKLIEAHSVDELLFDDFEKVKDLSPEEFVRDVLVEGLFAKEVVCGFNYRFGKGNTGDTKLLKDLLEKYGVVLSVVDKVEFEGSIVSSSLVRQALEKGDMPRARKLLGRPFFVLSKVVHGQALGRQMGFPTVNETLEEGRVQIPFGVYFSRAVLEDGRTFMAVVNVGVRPTVNSTDKAPTLEAHIIDFHEDIYGREVRVELFYKHRDEKKFDSIDALKDQISKDILKCKKYFEKGEDKK